MLAETNLFREKRQWFRELFPLFMKYVTGGYVSELEAGERLAQVDDRRGGGGVQLDSFGGVRLQLCLPP